MVGTRGIKAVSKAIDDPEEPFVWNNKVNCGFLTDLNGKMLAHPFKPGLKDHAILLDYADIKGKKFFVGFVNAAISASGMAGSTPCGPLPVMKHP
jgi:cytochrome c